MATAGFRQIKITQSDINNAIPRDSKHCMISDAVQRALPWATHISTDSQSVRFTNPKTKRRFFYLTPPSAAKALIKFDQGEEVKPFTMSLALGYTRAMRKTQKVTRESAETRKKREAKGRRMRKRAMPGRYREFGARALKQ